MSMDSTSNPYSRSPARAGGAAYTRTAAVPDSPIARACRGAVADALVAVLDRAVARACTGRRAGRRCGRSGADSARGVVCATAEPRGIVAAGFLVEKNRRRRT